MNWTSGARSASAIALPGAAEPLDVVAKHRAFGQIVRHDMEHAAEALDERRCPLPFEIGRKVRIFRPAGRDRPHQHAASLPRQTFDPCGLGFDVGRIDIDLHMQHALDADALRLGGVFLIGEIAVERRHAGKPRIVQGRAIDEMQMGVDDHWSSSQLSLSNHLTEEFFIQIRIYAADPTADPARCDSFSQVASSSSMVRVISGADGALTTVI